MLGHCFVQRFKQTASAAENKEALPRDCNITVEGGDAIA